MPRRCSLSAGRIRHTRQAVRPQGVGQHEPWGCAQAEDGGRRQWRRLGTAAAAVRPTRRSRSCTCLSRPPGSERQATLTWVLSMGRDGFVATLGWARKDMRPLLHLWNA